MRMMKKAPLTLLLLSLICAGCATTGGSNEEEEPTVIEAAPVPPADAAALEETATKAEDGASKEEEGEVPLVVAESEKPEEVSVQGRNLQPHQVIHDLVAEGQTLLRDVELQYFFTGKGKKQVLRGRPVAFALWS